MRITTAMLAARAGMTSTGLTIEGGGAAAIFIPEPPPWTIPICPVLIGELDPDDGPTVELHLELHSDSGSQFLAAIPGDRHVPKTSVAGAPQLWFLARTMDITLQASAPIAWRRSTTGRSSPRSRSAWPSSPRDQRLRRDLCVI